MIDILYVTHRVPYPLDKGERIRCAHILQALCEYAEVDLVSLADEPVHPKAQDFLSQFTRSIRILPLGRFRKYLRMCFGLLTGRSLTESAMCGYPTRTCVRDCLMNNKYDFIIVSNTGLFGIIPQLGNNVKILVDMMDVDSRKWQAYAENAFWLRPLYRRESKLISALETEIVNRADAVFVTTQRELSLLPRGKSLCRAVGNGVDSTYFVPQVPASRHLSDLVFVGALDYWPNVDALCWFMDQVWPRVLEVIPQGIFHIVGRRPNARIRKLSRLPRVQLHHDVADIRPIVQRCGIAVFPLRLAFGIPNKVLEAMAMGRLCIIPPFLSDVVGGIPGVHYLLAEQSEDWVRIIGEMQHCPEQAEEIAGRARMFVVERYVWTNQLDELIKVITSSQTQSHSISHA
ncbi:MAG: glycosyltransferase [Gemmatales bacterium]|nr:glycosyltransferase [Gemmatales bacterium]